MKTSTAKTAAAGAVGGAALSGIIAAAAVFIEPHEGRVNRTYTDPAGYTTTCVGNRSAAIPGATFTNEECDLLLLSDVIVHVIAIRKLVTVPMSDEMWIAAVSLSFNVGWGAVQKSTFLRKLNAGDTAGAGAEFQYWINAGGRPLNGLIVRRAREAALFLANPKVS